MISGRKASVLVSFLAFIFTVYCVGDREIGEREWVKEKERGMVLVRPYAEKRLRNSFSLFLSPLSPSAKSIRDISRWYRPHKPGNKIRHKTGNIFSLSLSLLFLVLVLFSLSLSLTHTLTHSTWTKENIRKDSKFPTRFEENESGVFFVSLKIPDDFFLHILQS